MKEELMNLSIEELKKELRNKVLEASVIKPIDFKGQYEPISLITNTFSNITKYLTASRVNN
jgi:hypothetical protein